MGRGGAAWPNGPGAPALMGQTAPPKENLGFLGWENLPFWGGRSSPPTPPLGRRPRGLGQPPNRPSHLYKEGEGQGRHHPKLPLAGRPLFPLSSSTIPCSGCLAKPCRIFFSTSTTTPSCFWICEEIYITTSAARWNEERKDGIDSVRATEDGSAAGTLHRFDRLHQQRA